MTTRRQVLNLLVLSAFGGYEKLHAQHKTFATVGLLALESGQLLEPLRAGLRNLGYLEGKNIHLEERAAGDRYDRLAEIATEFAKLPVDVIVTAGGTATSAARRATSTIPIVMVAGLDPIKAGFAASLSRP